MNRFLLLPAWASGLNTPFSEVSFGCLPRSADRQPLRTIVDPQFGRLGFGALWILSFGGKKLARVGVLQNSKENSVAWRRFFRIRFDPNDTIEAALKRLGDKRREANYLLKEQWNSIGEEVYTLYHL